MEILLIVSIGIMNILCFFVGAKIGQKVVNKETIEIPNLNPIKALYNAKQEKKERKEKEAEDEYVKTIMYNIDNYDGTSKGQKTIPRR